MNMEEFANHIIAVAKENNRPITNLQLQKVMYFTFRISRDEHLVENHYLREMYDEKFEVWQFGPVIRSQYERFRGFASEPIIGKFNKVSFLDNLNGLIVELLDENVFELVELSHRLPFWQNNKDTIVGFRSNTEYSFEDI